MFLLVLEGLFGMNKKDNYYTDWEDKHSRKNKKSENRKNRKRVNSKELMERFTRDDYHDDLYKENEKFHNH